MNWLLLLRSRPPTVPAVVLPSVTDVVFGRALSTPMTTVFAGTVVEPA